MERELRKKSSLPRVLIETKVKKVLSRKQRGAALIELGGAGAGQRRSQGDWEGTSSGNRVARPALRRANDCSRTKVHGCCRAVVGTGHRSQHGNLQLLDVVLLKSLPVQEPERLVLFARWKT